jgi:formamidopyrimidine-DNA glycosylase
LPELPEVETTVAALQPCLQGLSFVSAIVRQPRLRCMVPDHLADLVSGRRIVSLVRRAKYVLVSCDQGGLLIHLGMSGHLRYYAKPPPEWRKHDHIIFKLSSGGVLCFYDPRRFGLVDWTNACVTQHRLLNHLGMEPLASSLTAKWLYGATRSVKRAIKVWLMDQRCVVGVGNIYAQEALFCAGILPHKLARCLTLQECLALKEALQGVLRAAIEAGGSSLQDFYRPGGAKGYFQMSHQVYGRQDLACYRCGQFLSRVILGGRATVYCLGCQH